LCLAWTWPLAAHLHTAIPGRPGDNYSFLWNFWWMRHVLDTPGASYFRTTHLFYPLGTNLANHSHTALLALVGATVFGTASIVTALNILILATLFLNMATMYALAWDLTGHRRAAVLSGVLFGLSPYVAVRLLGHFELLGVWVLPLFALCVRRALEDGSGRWSVSAGIVMAVTAYVAYYYVVYLGLFLVAYVAAATRCLTISAAPRARSRTAERVRRGALTVLWVAIAVALVVFFTGLFTGGTVLRLGSARVAVRTPQNALSAAWLAGAVWALARWRVTVRWNGFPAAGAPRPWLVPMIAIAVFVAGSAPLLFQAARLVWTGEYATTGVFWRSVPRGVDLAAPLLGPPANPVTGGLTRAAYQSLHLDFMEGLGWIGCVPLVLLFLPRQALLTKAERGVWLAVAGVFLLWALGPFLTIGGFDTGLKLPQFLVQFVPIVSNAHMPGRAIVGVYLALAVVAALRVSRCRGRLQRPGFQWLLVALLALEYADAPIPLTSLDQPAVYGRLAAEPAGGVCEAPFGIGDGLSAGLGAQDHVVLYYATLHGHPLAGGWVGRMPRGAAARYEALPVTGTLLQLSGGPSRGPGALTSQPGADLRPPCDFVVLNRAAASPELVAYVRSLPATLVESAEGRDLYRLLR
jgi:hypothetical protein